MRPFFFSAMIGAAAAACCAVEQPSGYQNHAGNGGAGGVAKEGGVSGAASGASTSMGEAGTFVGSFGGSSDDLGVVGGAGGVDVTADAGMSVVEPPVAVCSPTVPADPVIADFRNTGQTMGISFGDYAGGFSGYSYQYGAGVMSDVTAGVWHLKGMVSEPSGFGLGFNYDNGHNADASGYAGVEFTMKGNVGPAGSLTLGVQHGPDSAPTTFSSCAKCAAGDCGDPVKTFTVGQSETKVSLKWSDFTGGRPQSSVDPKQLLGLIWFFDWHGQGTPYPIDLTIVDVKFIAGGSDAGAD